MRWIAFALGLLVGIKVPGFVDQYTKRVSAHQLEVARNFSGFRATANQFFGGSADPLIARHGASPDAAFKDEARNIREMDGRLQILTAELAALQGPLIKQIVQVAFRRIHGILHDTRAAYTYAVPLTPAAIISGVTIGALLAMLIETLFIGGYRLLRPHRSRIAAVPQVR